MWLVSVDELHQVPTNGPHGHQEYNTIDYEVHEQLGGTVPDLIAAPTAFST